MIDEGYIKFSCDRTADAEQRLFKHLRNSK
jgi:hypothetical protein